MGIIAMSADIFGIIIILVHGEHSITVFYDLGKLFLDTHLVLTMFPSS